MFRKSILSGIIYKLISIKPYITQNHFDLLPKEPNQIWYKVHVISSSEKQCNKVCQWLAKCRWLSPGTPVSSTNKTDRRDIVEILLKVALNTITNNPNLEKPNHAWLKHQVESSSEQPNYIWKILHAKRYIPYTGAVGTLPHIDGRSQRENWYHLFCRKHSFLTGLHSQFLSVCNSLSLISTIYYETTKGVASIEAPEAIASVKKR